MEKEISFEQEVTPELGKLLDALNTEYGFEYYKDEKGTYTRFDLQCDEMGYEYTLKDVLDFYISAIETVLDYVHSDGETCPTTEVELALLKKYYPHD